MLYSLSPIVLLILSVSLLQTKMMSRPRVVGGAPDLKNPDLYYYMLMYRKGFYNLQNLLIYLFLYKL